MNFKIRTIYIKSRDISKLKTFYSKLFDIKPKLEKDTDEWVEFDFGNINLSFLPLPAEDGEINGSNCVPVFEFNESQVMELKKKVVECGGKILLEDYDGAISAVCCDIEGNEFEITTFHD